MGPWALFMAMFAVVAIAGIVVNRRNQKVARVLLHLFLAGAAGYFLALGDQGPFGGLYHYAFDHLLGFQVMREPQKFVALVALFYAFAFGLGVKFLWERASTIAPRIIAVAAALLIPALLTPTLFNGLGGGAKPHSYPASWYEADRLMGSGDGSVLFLPWHQYMDLRFADNRRIGTPASAFFRRDAITGDNVELPNLASSSTSPRSGYLEYLYSVGNQISVMGRALSPLGVRYIAVDHSADWRQFAWLDHQQDLHKVLDTSDFQLYENLAFHGSVTQVTNLHTVNNWTDMLREISSTGERADNFVATNRSGDPLGEPLPAPPTLVPEGTTLRIDRKNDATVRVAGASGNTSTYNLAEPFDEAWHLSGTSGTVSAAGSVLWANSAEGSSFTFLYAGWPAQRFRYAISLTATALLALLAYAPLHRVRILRKTTQ
jgi:hypothetical protein